MNEPLAILVREYGPWILLAYIVAKEIWPPIRDRLIPQYATERKKRNEMERDASWLKLEAELEERRQERCHREELERLQVEAWERQAQNIEHLVAAIEGLTKEFHAMGVNLTQSATITNERLTAQLGGFGELARKIDKAIDRDTIPLKRREKPQ